MKGKFPTLDFGLCLIQTEVGFSAAVATNIIECVQNVFSKRRHVSVECFQEFHMVQCFNYLQCMCYKILKAEGLSMKSCRDVTGGLTSCVVFAAQRLQTSESARNCGSGGCPQMALIWAKQTKSNE